MIFLTDNIWEVWELIWEVSKTQSQRKPHLDI